MKAIYTVQGVNGLKAALEQGSEDMKKRVSVACEITAKRVQRLARSRAPRDKGDLIRSIQVAGKGLNWRVGLDNATLTMRGGSSAHQNPAVYGVWYELGFKTKHIDADPYMKRSGEDEEQGHVDRTEAAINAALGG